MSDDALEKSSSSAPYFDTDEFSSRYEVEAKLGIGGIETVYRALDKLLSRRVAIKVLQLGHDLNGRK